MIPYIVVFIASAALLIGSEKLQISSLRKGAISKGFAITAILLPCILAGARDVGIGTDSGGYGILFFNLVQESGSFLDYVQLCHHTSWDPEPLFVLMAYVVVSATDSLFCYWFLIELLILAPIYFAINNMCKGRRVWLPFLFYLVLFYGLGLNMMRQGIAISFATLSLSQFLASKNREAIASAICAVLFHFSALIVIAYWVMLTLLFSFESDKLRPRRYAKATVPLFAIGVLVFWMIIPDLPSVLMPVFGDRYGYYVNKVGYELHYAFPVFTFACILLEIVIYYAQNGRGDCLLTALSAIAFSAVALFPLTVLSQWLVRLSYYPLMAIVLLLAACVGEERLKLDPGLGALIAGACFVSFYFYVFKGFDEVIPYASSLLGI